MILYFLSLYLKMDRAGWWEVWMGYEPHPAICYIMCWLMTNDQAGDDPMKCNPPLHPRPPHLGPLATVTGNFHSVQMVPQDNQLNLNYTYTAVLFLTIVLITSGGIKRKDNWEKIRCRHSCSKRSRTPFNLGKFASYVEIVSRSC